MNKRDARHLRRLERFDPYDPEIEDEFFEVVDDLREECPVSRSEAQGGFWAVTRFEEVRTGLANDNALSPVPTVTIPPNPGAVSIIPQQCERDEHREYRRLLDPYFRAGAVAKYEQGIRAICAELIDGFIERGRCEFIAEFARRLPGAVAFRLFLGLPESELDEAYRWSLRIVQSVNQPDGARVHERFMELIGRLVDARSAQPRRDDVVDAILYGTVLGRRLTRDEVQRTLMLLITAGLRTTASALGYSMIRMARDPALRTRLTANPQLLPQAIEEFLRLEPPSAGAVRTARQNMVIGGRQVREGDLVWLLIAGGNRDPRAFDRPDEVDFDRKPSRHLAFGYGARYCLGVHLARLELRVALGELLTRLGQFWMDDTPVTYDPGCSRGPNQLNLSFTPGGTRPRRQL